MGFLCCGPRRSATAKRRGGSYKANANGYPAPEGSVVTDPLDWHDCREEFSVTEGHSPTSSGNNSPRNSLCLEGTGRDSTGKAGEQSAKILSEAPRTAAAVNKGNQPAASPFSPGSEEYHDSTPHPHDGSESSAEDAAMHEGRRAGVGCLSILDNIRLHTALSAKQDSAKFEDTKHRRGSQRKSGKPNAGASLKKRDPETPMAEARDCWDVCSGTGFKVRGLDYMRLKKKQYSTDSIYELIAADYFNFPQKTYHIAKLVNLPRVTPPKSMTGAGAVELAHYPLFLIFNIQCPMYPPSLFGGKTDGNGLSIVLYYKLRDDFDPQTFENRGALGMLKRFVQNGREADQTMTRDRLKLIPRVTNVEELAVKGPLTGAEHKLLFNYNEKPILTRPQQEFFSGHNYLEVDLDIHQYTYLARNAFVRFLTRMKEVVFEIGLVIQGNTNDELPEQILACAKFCRIDFATTRLLGDCAGNVEHGLHEDDRHNSQELHENLQTIPSGQPIPTTQAGH